ncbi:hypothetical protein KKG20_02730 [bacterium]|nr:hypothetical protein [bacterium]
MPFANAQEPCFFVLLRNKPSKLSLSSLCSEITVAFFKATDFNRPSFSPLGFAFGILRRGILSRRRRARD